MRHKEITMKEKKRKTEKNRILRMESIVLLSLIVLTAFFLSSCSESGEVSNGEEGEKSVTLRISGACYGGSRSSGTPSDESLVNNLVIAVLDGGTVEDIREIKAPSVSSGSITQEITYHASTPLIRVLANVPAGTFTGLTTKAAFDAALADLDYTTGSYSDGMFTPAVGSASSTGLQQSGLLPMAGTAGIVGSDGTATVNLYRLVSRISLTSVHTDFSSSGPYAGWTFRIDQVYLVNVPTRSTLTSEWDTAGGGASAVTSLPCQGETANSSSYRSYLGTGVLTDVNATVSAYTGNPYFYVFPNGSRVFSGQMRLEIKGELRDASGTSKGICYYPVVINRSQAGTQISNSNSGDRFHSGSGTVGANRTYALSVMLKTKGTTSAEADLNPSDIDLSVTVSGWSSVLTQNVVFN